MTTSRGHRYTDDRDRITLNVRVDDETGCWQWLHFVDPVTGYGRVYDPRTRNANCAHRYSYEVFVGPIPDGLHLDHLCRNRACVNPEHLEPVTCAENSLRSPLTNVNKVECKFGHEFTAENTYLDPSGRRVCKTCRRNNRLAFEARRRALRAA